MKLIDRVISDEKKIFFAPEYYYDNEEYLYVTCGLEDERVYEQKDWGTHKEKWYKYGNNYFSCYKKSDDGHWKIVCENVIDVSEFDDVMKIAVVESNNKLMAWFSGLKDEKWNIYFAEIDLPGVENCENNYHYRKINIAPTYESEIHYYLPCVIYEGIYKMWYASRDKDHRRIFYAESEDGVNWTKNRMVLDIGDDVEGDNYASDCPNVVRKPEGYIMLYGGGTSRGIHLAFSENGLNWSKKGMIIPRGAETDDTYNYSFYPAIACKDKMIDDLKKLTIYFAGEDICNNWRILSIDYDILQYLQRKDFVESSKVKEIITKLKNVPSIYFEPQEDCNSKEFFYDDGELLQLRPSTVPVFKYKDIVIKVMKDRVRAESEYRARLALNRDLDIIDVSIFYYQDMVLLLMPYMEIKCCLNELLMEDEYKFIKMFSQVLSDSAKILEKNTLSAYIDKMQYTGQTLEFMSQWCDEIQSSYRGVELINIRSGNIFNISEELKKSKELIFQKAKSCSLFNGDLNLHNVLCVGDNINYIDFEYWGYYDLEYIIAKIIGSFYKHCEWISKAKCSIKENKLYIDYEVKESLAPLFLLETYEEKFKRCDINYERVKAYMMCKLYFRFMNAYDYLQDKFENAHMEKDAINEMTRVLGVLELFK